MSQWNNSYYNSQYQGPNEWNAGSNQQYVDQNVYYQGGQFDPGSQYVSFNDFITQMQGASGANVNTSNYNNQYQYSEQYNVNQYNQSEASTSQATVPIASYDAVAGPSSESNHQPSYNDGTQIEETHNHKTKKPFKSKLTPTASEFVPKNSVKHSNTYSNKSAESGTNYNNESKNYSRSNNSDSNWRERPSSSSHGNNHNNGSSNHSNGYNYKNQDNKNRETNYNRNRDSSPRVQDSNSKNDSRNESSNKYQKSGSKSKNRDVDSGRTFYSSSSAKSNHDNRNGRWEGGYKGKNWGGSQRLRAMDRNSADDEQYANTYLQHREDRERDKRETERPGKGRSGSSPARSRNKQTNLGGNQDTAKELTQRERLIDQLDKGTLECLVCCERVRQTDTVWSCSNCFHVLHLRCIRKWAMSSLLDGKWRCPACQNVSDTVPTEYRCMCGAVRNPEWQRGACGAHTCGRACKRPRSCPHPCTLLCHPGPCPPCQATVNKQCGCGAETRSVLCSSKLVQVCGRVCGRTLSCELHKCTKDCHEGPCDECDKTIDQVCHCPGVKSRTVPCTRHTSRTPHYSCGDACGRVLACGAHVCRASCHPPPCPDCDKSPERLDTCPCGKIKLEKGARKSCTSPIPLCGNICARPLPCGPQGDRHFCKQECHEGECPPCPDKTVLQCRCGHSSREVPCTDLPQVLGNVFCQRKCNKKLSCGRHRCREQCCALESHRCGVVCGRSLSCQLHRCEELCHTGHCAPCPRLGFTELRCACGLQVALPPLACGARAPPCSAACPRRRQCGHEPHHSCHTGACPPCVVLTTKRCYGGHEERKTIPCSQEEFSCGMACGKPLPCGKHTCIKVCHKGPCDTEKCVQPCRAVREACGHACAAACHAAAGGPCPAPAPCRALVRAHCACGRRHQPALCADNMARRNEILAALAATKMQDGGTVDLSEVNRPSNNLKTLECDDECRVEQRTRQMALALQIRNPDISSKLAPKYSEHVRQWATKEPSFAQSVHNNLTNLVQLAKKSKQKTRSHSFPSMNRQKRQFIHEMCEHFGCESVAYDAEPNRNVVATADKEKSWLPAMSVLEVLSREAGRRRVPGPVLRAPPAPAAAHAAAAALAPAAAPASSSRTGWTTLKPTNPWATRSQPSQSTTSNQEPPAAPKIDYFDNPPE